jgi:hypothetical protein
MKINKNEIQVAPLRTFRNAHADEAHLSVGACSCATCHERNPEGHPLFAWSDGNGTGYLLALPEVAADALVRVLQATQAGNAAPVAAWEATKVVGNC